MQQASSSSVAMSTIAPLHGKKLTQKQVDSAGLSIFATLFVLAVILAVIVWYLATHDHKTAAVVVGCYFGCGILASALVSGDTLFYLDAKKNHVYVSNSSQPNSSS